MPGLARRSGHERISRRNGCAMPDRARPRPTSNPSRRCSRASQSRALKGFNRPLSGHNANSIHITWAGLPSPPPGNRPGPRNSPGAGQGRAAASGLGSSGSCSEALRAPDVAAPGLGLGLGPALDERLGVGRREGHVATASDEVERVEAGRAGGGVGVGWVVGWSGVGVRPRGRRRPPPSLAQAPQVAPTGPNRPPAGPQQAHRLALT